MLSRRHRRRRFQQEESRRIRIVPIIAIAGALFITYYLGSVVLGYFGVGNNIRNSAVELTVEQNGVVNVSLEGSAMKRADSGVKLYPGDVVETTSANYAALTFFDGSHVRLDENTRVNILESKDGEESSSFAISLQSGQVWVYTPVLETYSGAIVRTVKVDAFEAQLPAETEAVLSSNFIAVYSADSLGVSLMIPDAQGEYYIGEGQEFTLPSTADKSKSLYTHRTPITGDRERTAFIAASRDALLTTGTGSLALPVLGDEELLTIVEPLDGAEISGSTVEVTGRYGVNVDKVRINGYLATLDPEQGTFAQELALPDEDTVTITVEAVDADGVVVEELRRSVTRDREPPTSPTITAPAAANTVYKTNLQQFELRGTVPPGTIGVIVNDYRLQLFNPGDTTWSYLASVRLENLKLGENIFNIYAIGSNTLRSEPATITIIIGEGEEGVVSSAAPNAGSTTSEGTSSSEPEQVEESTLPQNAPLLPGTLTVQQPEAGTTHTTSEVELLIEGSTDPSTDSIWVNGYKLRLFEPGKTFWNYIASSELGTMKRGQNTYKVNARNSEGQIVDSLTYVITFNP